MENNTESNDDSKQPGDKNSKSLKFTKRVFKPSNSAAPSLATSTVNPPTKPLMQQQQPPQNVQPVYQTPAPQPQFHQPQIPQQQPHTQNWQPQRQNNIGHYHPKPQHRAPAFKQLDISEIKLKISNSLKNDTFVISKESKDSAHHPNVTYEFSLKPTVNELKEIENYNENYFLPTSPTSCPDIFSLYYVMLQKEAEEKRQRELELERQEKLKKEQEELKKKQEQDRLKRLHEEQQRKLREEKFKVNKSPNKRRAKVEIKPNEVTPMSEKDLEKFLKSVPEKDKYLLRTLIMSVRETGKMDHHFLRKIVETDICNIEPTLEMVNSPYVSRKGTLKELADKPGHGGRNKGGYGGRNKGGYDKYDKYDKFEKNKRYSQYDNNKSYNDSGGFARKELSEDQKLMKRKAAQIRQKLEDRNSLAGSKLELEIKFIMNRITPSSYAQLSQNLIDIMKKNDYSRDVLSIIANTTFNKSCVEKKYTSMYSDLVNKLYKQESMWIVKNYADNIQKFIEDYFPKPTDPEEKYDPPKIKDKVNSKLAKKASIIKSTITDCCKSHIIKIGSDANVDKDDPDYEEKCAKHKEKVIGNVRFIGALFNIDIFNSGLMFNIIQTYLIHNWQEKLKNDPECVLNEYDNDLLEGCCVILNVMGKKMEEYINSLKDKFNSEFKDASSEEKQHQLKTHKKYIHISKWDGIFELLYDVSQNEKQVESRLRILIKNLMSVRENGWENEDEEGPLKLKDLHKKVRNEQKASYAEDYYDYEREYEYQESKKSKSKYQKPKEDRRSKFPAGIDFVETGGGKKQKHNKPKDDYDDDEDFIIEEHKSTPKVEVNRFKDIEEDALADICIGNYKEYKETKEFAFDTFKEALENGIPKTDLIFGIFYKLFDQKEDEVKGFETYFLEMINELAISKEDLTVGLDKYNTELTNLECDLPHVDMQYSEILYKLMLEDVLDVPALKWMNDREDEESSDIFIKILIRIVEHKYVESEHDTDETKEFIEKLKIKEILERLQKWLLEEDLVDSYKEEVTGHEMIYKMLGLPE